MACGDTASSQVGARTITVAGWNLQCMFDGVTVGNEYADYKDDAGWTDDKYLARRNAFKEALKLLPAGGWHGKKGADIIALIEVENEGVLEAMASDAGSDCGYGWTFFAAHPEMSLGLGVASRFPIAKTALHSIVNDGELNTPRPIAEVWFEIDGNPLVLLICHWKSKLGGDDKTDERRMDAATVILRRVREIEAEKPDTPIVVLGDFNQNHDDFFRYGRERMCAFMPDDEEAAALAGFTADLEETPESVRAKQKNFFILSNEKPPTASFFPDGVTVFYTPWGWEILDGSYWYKNDWETIDNILLNTPFWTGKGWRFDAATVMNTEPFVNRKGRPAVYNPRTGYGLSDHLPMVVTLRLDAA
jgi:endonuclease/exonuclease/phosphatase family metal-dependent hydrolase